MSILKVIFEFIVIYFLLKLVFDVIIPIYRTGKQVKRKMNEMQERMQENAQQPFTAQQEKPESGSKAKPVSSDYIDYEEIK